MDLIYNLAVSGINISSLPLIVISLIFLVLSSIHFSLRIFSVALIRSFNFLISCREMDETAETMCDFHYPNC